MKKTSYHHGALAEALLNAVDEIAMQFGLEAVSLRACAKKVGVSPSSAFRHYADKRALLTAFATRAMWQLINVMSEAREAPDPLKSVSLAYVDFALSHPYYFRVMWREEGIYIQDEHYLQAAAKLKQLFKAGFAETLPDDDPERFSSIEILAWSGVHGVASLLTEGHIGKQLDQAQKLDLAAQMIDALSMGLNASQIAVQTQSSRPD